jgi:hypothetical protein
MNQEVLAKPRELSLLEEEVATEVEEASKRGDMMKVLPIMVKSMLDLFPEN